MEFNTVNPVQYCTIDKIRTEIKFVAVSLSIEQEKKLIHMLLEHHILSTADSDVGLAEDINTIKLETNKLIRVQVRRFQEHLHQEIEKECEDLLKGKSSGQVNHHVQLLWFL